jgi:hypothetical protein
MTPIKDYGYWLRQRLIHDKRSVEQKHYQELIKKGLTEVDAANMSGWHPVVEIDKHLRRVGWALIWSCVTIFLFFYADLTAASMAKTDKLEELKNLEHNVTWCMQGKPMKVGSEWFKCTCLSSDDPRGCPEER